MLDKEKELRLELGIPYIDPCSHGKKKDSKIMNNISSHGQFCIQRCNCHEFSVRCKRVYSQMQHHEREREWRLRKMRMCGFSHKQEPPNSFNIMKGMNNTELGKEVEVEENEIDIHSQGCEIDRPMEKGKEIESIVDSVETAKFVKVIMEGVPFGRNINLNAHESYHSLALAIQYMFQRPIMGENGVRLEDNAKHPWLLDENCEYMLTYVDKDGDWMLVGDAPWRMFVNCVERILIARRSSRIGDEIEGGERKYQRVQLMPNV